MYSTVYLSRERASAPAPPQKKTIAGVLASALVGWCLRVPVRARIHTPSHPFWGVETGVHTYMRSVHIKSKQKNQTNT